MEISDVFVHADGFVGFAGLDELDLGLFVPLLVLEFEGEFEVYISDFVLGVLVSHLEGLVEISLVGQVLHNCIDQIHLQHHLHTLLGPQRFRPLLGQFAGVLILAVEF